MKLETIPIPLLPQRNRHPTKQHRLKIKSMALGRNKKVHSEIFTSNVLKGMRSTVSVFPASSRKTFYSSSDFEGTLCDFEALTADAETIGDCFQHVIDMVEEKSADTQSPPVL
ncbi:MAG: hypothetical protein F6K19_46550 [Cyanothece sp. SIO1E1]|nr:hypothetical protein [Cyanothece sp. SIO1E1]